jgi:glycerate-2-kinase
MGGKIKNFEGLATTPARKFALGIAEAGLRAIDTEQSILSRLSLENDVLKIDHRPFDLKDFERVFIVGVGKCALEAGRALEKIFGERLTGGVILTVGAPSSFEIRNSKLEIRFGTHPFPTEANVDATSDIVRLLSSLTEKDFVMFVISGGGSTLLCQPQNMVCTEEGNLLKILFEKGATIQEINTIRKHLSLARGGHLAAYAYPATSVALIFSDVPGDNLEFVASGPTVKDVTTVDEARVVIKKYDLEKSTGLKIEPLETPKEDKYFEKIENVLFVSNTTALSAMKARAEAAGFKAEITTVTLKGEAREVGENIAGDVAELPDKTVRLYGGETTVTVERSGRGGRNQELVLGALNGITKGTLVLSFDSDGHDNQSGYAGALCDIITKEKAEKLNLRAEKFLKENDSAGFFEKVGDCIEMGDTGSNVSDLIIALKL